MAKERRRKEPPDVVEARRPSLVVWSTTWLAHPEAGERIERARRLRREVPFDAIRQALVKQLLIEAATILLSEPDFAALFPPETVAKALVDDVEDTAPTDPAYLLRLQPDQTWTLATSGDPPEVAIEGRIPLDQVDAVKQYAAWQQARLRDEDVKLPAGRPKGSRQYPREVFRAKFEQAVRLWVENNHGRRPSKEDMKLQLQAENMPVSMKTLEAQLRDCYPRQRWDAVIDRIIGGISAVHPR
jgi:hypothetical protein